MAGVVGQSSLVAAMLRVVVRCPGGHSLDDNVDIAKATQVYSNQTKIQCDSILHLAMSGVHLCCGQSLHIVE